MPDQPKIEGNGWNKDRSRELFDFDNL